MSDDKRNRMAEELDRIKRGHFSQTQRLMLEEVRRHCDGISRGDLAKSTARTVSTVQSALATLQAAGLVCSTKNGALSRWTTPDRVKQVHEQILREVIEKQMARGHVWNAARAKMRLANSCGEDDETDESSVQRSVPALGAVMPCTQAVNSVFALGAQQ